MREWLLAGSADTSTPTKPTSQNPAPVSPENPSQDAQPCPIAPADANVSDGQPSDVREPAQQAVDCSRNSIYEFESTTSSYLLNVDSYCRQLAQEASSTSSDPNMVEFNSTTSSFMLTVDSFCALEPSRAVEPANAPPEEAIMGEILCL